MQIPDLAAIWRTDPVLQQVSDLAAETGSDVYLVGGALRDVLLGRPVGDIDLALSGAVEFARRVAERLDGTFVPLHEDFATARVVVNAKHAQQRRELDFAELRGPDIVADLRARDFTVDACAWLVTSTSSELLDPCGGLDDLDSGIIRAISRDNLAADPLRCLRAFRLAAELDFAIEPTTLGWIGELAPQISDVAGERVGAELMRLLAADGAVAVLRQMDEVGLLEQILPEIKAARGVRQGGHHHLDVWGHSLLTAQEMEKTISAPEGLLPGAGPYVAEYVSSAERRAGLKLAALLHDLGKPGTKTVDEQGHPWFRGHEEEGAKLARGVARRLRLTRRTREMLGRLIVRHLRPLNLVEMAIHNIDEEGQPPRQALTLSAIRRLMRQVEPDGVGVLMLALADLRACQGPATDPVQRQRAAVLIDQMLVRYFEWADKQAVEPLLTGQDLIDELGLEPGPDFRVILEEIEDARADGIVTTRQEALKLARRLAEQMENNGASDHKGT